MLVYANHLRIEGAGAEDAVFKAVGGWLKEQMAFGLPPAQLRQDGSFRGKRGETPSRLRVYTCSDTKPSPYSWVLDHPDEQVRGRKWAVEIGAKVMPAFIEVSCVVRTDRRSAVVSGRVAPAQPRVMRYIIANIVSTNNARFADTVPGEEVKVVSTDDEYRALGFDIARSDRSSAVVLVSPSHDEKCLLDVYRLQSSLIGLAQVVYVSPEGNTYRMEKILGRSKSAWAGAVNVLGVPTRGGRVPNRLFRAEEIVELGVEAQRISGLLSWVTESTNTLRLRDHLRPDSVAMQATRLRLRRKIDASTGETKEFERLLDETLQEKEDIVGERDEIELSLLEAKDELGQQGYEMRSLKSQLSESSGRQDTIDGEWWLQRVLARAKPSPSDCLRMVEEVHSERCIVLPSARASADKSASFAHGRQLLDLMQRLVTKYREGLKGAGDSKAKHVFGRSEFAARESDTVMGSPSFRRYRYFRYEGARVPMYRHLKIGVADDVTQTIRVHFHWDAEREKIVIGYCGPHLPVPSH